MIGTGDNRKLLRSWIIFSILSGLFILIIFLPGIWRAGLESLFPTEREVLFARASLPVLVIEHLVLVFISSSIAVSVGIITGIAVTRPWGRDFLDIVNDLSSLGQTIPPVAVLFLAVPLIGFGTKPTVVALVLYSMLPVIRNTISGIESVNPVSKDAAFGMGMKRSHVLRKIELPIAMRVIFAGIRISVVINIGTATIGATVGAGGLGTPIVSGLVRENPAIVLQGALTSALLALLIDRLLALVEKTFFPSPWRDQSA
ncbi:MAG: ABC transporter permease [Spirochaetia bacterium]